MPASSPQVVSSTSVRLSECPVCSGTSLKELPLPGHWIGRDIFEPYRRELGLSQCRSCSFVFTNPRPSQQLLDSFYAGDAYSCHGTDFSLSAHKKALYLLSRFEAHGPYSANRSLLDFGCGGGCLLKHASSTGWNVTGFDIGQRAIENCRRQGLPITNQISDLPPGQFDVVVLNHVLEHIGEPQGLVDLLKTLLGENGKLFIEVPNARSLRATLSLPLFSRRLKVDERYRAFPIHLSYFSTSTLPALLTNSRLNIVAVETNGIGLEELFIRPQEEALCLHPSNVAHRASESRFAGMKGRAKNLFKQLIFGLSLGENILVVSRR